MIGNCVTGENKIVTVHDKPHVSLPAANNYCDH